MGDFPLAERAIFAMGVRLPVVAFDGQPKIAGGISLQMISEELEKRGPTLPQLLAGRGGK